MLRALGDDVFFFIFFLFSSRSGRLERLEGSLSLGGQFRATDRRQPCRETRNGDGKRNEELANWTEGVVARWTRRDGL